MDLNQLNAPFLRAIDVYFGSGLFCSKFGGPTNQFQIPIGNTDKG